jgi:hypothetical protein
MSASASKAKYLRKKALNALCQRYAPAPTPGGPGLWRTGVDRRPIDAQGAVSKPSTVRSGRVIHRAGGNFHTLSTGCGEDLWRRVEITFRGRCSAMDSPTKPVPHSLWSEKCSLGRIHRGNWGDVEQAASLWPTLVVVYLFVD